MSVFLGHLAHKCNSSLDSLIQICAGRVLFEQSTLCAVFLG